MCQCFTFVLAEILGCIHTQALSLLFQGKTDTFSFLCLTSTLCAPYEFVLTSLSSPSLSPALSLPLYFTGCFILVWGSNYGL